MTRITLLFEKFKFFFKKHESVLSSVGLVSGFVLDYLTLERVDFLFDNLLIIFYLLFAGTSIIVINLREAGRLKNRFFESIYEFLPFLVQFSFGGLFSAFVVFYSKSASLFTSGAFILILLTLLIGNEFFKHRYSRLVFQVGIYFIAIFSFSIYFLPVLTREMGVAIFILSGLVSLVLISLFIFIIARLTPVRFQESSRLLFITVLVLYTFTNLLYFTNIIPPIPLSLKAGEVFHFVERQSDGDYLTIGKKKQWYEKFKPRDLVALNPGEPVYVFSSVFAPTDISVDIVHDWQYYDDGQDKWVSVTKISFPMRGGRNEGYRGFSMKTNIFEGKWRVDVKTQRGQVIGRIRFDIDISSAPPELEIKII
jgi:hypothetical protein